jgi:hypothetical protein
MSATGSVSSLGGATAPPITDFTSPLPFRPHLAPFFASPPYASTDIFAGIAPMISPHPDAPLFNGTDAALVLRQVLDECLGGNAPASERFMDLVRQAATVNLWFFLRVVAAYAGAYGDINTQLHMEMCNFRQVALEPGGYFAAFTPRGSFKSSIMNTGANPWEFVRNPDLTIGVFSATIDKAQEFYMQTKAVMDSNSLFRELWPGIVPESTGRGSEWNDSSLNIAGRRKRKATPSFASYTASGSVSGTHIDVADIDDIVTDAMLNAVRSATSALIEKRNWFNSNIHSLRDRVSVSRTIVQATRYSIEDPYEGVQLDSREQFGDWTVCADRYPLKPRGLWQTYYRSAKAFVGDQEVSIQPAAYSLEFLDGLAERDPWTYHYQYENNAIGVSGSQLAAYTPAECVFTDDGIEVVNTDETVRYVECDITVAIDPAGRSTRAGARTSQTAMIVLCRDSRGRMFVSGRKGYVKTTEWFDWIFGRAEFFGDALGRTVIEEVSGFKSLDSVILREQYQRGIRLRYRPIAALGDKIATIQAIVQPELEAGRVYIDKRLRGPLMDELKVFPNGSAMDLLDALKIAIKCSKRPEREAAADDVEDEGLERLMRSRASTAY